jgi:translocation and assembly module TamA
MYARLSLQRKMSGLCLVLACGLFLNGCSLGNILRGGVQPNYSLQGVESDEDTAAYLRTILEERTEEQSKTLRKDDEQELRDRQEEYISQTIRADLIKALHARGYYAADVTFIEGVEDLSGEYKITYGPQFVISVLDVVPNDYAQHLPPDIPVKGDILDAVTILAAQRALEDNIGKDKCFFDLSVDNRVRLDRARNTGAVELVADVGREGKFGPLSFEGNIGVKESYLRKLVPLREGRCFRRDRLERYKTALMQSGLFAQADIILPEDGPDEDGKVPIQISLKERAHRTISAGLTYYSDEGPGGILSWEHRNFLGAAEKFKASLNLSQLKQSIGADFSKPYFLKENQTLTLNTEMRRQDTDAFEELAMDFGGGISRKFNRRLSGSVGIEASILRITDHTQNTKETYGLLSAPGSLSYDNRNDALDPRRGLNLQLTAEPFFDILGEADPFFKIQLTGSSYFPITNNGDTLIAAKASIGSIQGADLDSIPATERFYAGGGGTVRGYGYQEVGPQKNGDPTGGRSIATASLELRTKLTDKFGGVVFVDAGSVSEETTPNFDNMAVGAGIGIRYYTSFGPVRFDIATPLTEKENTDQNYQFYISIGQAF